MPGPEPASAGPDGDLRVDAEWVAAGPFRPERLATAAGGVVVLLDGLVARTTSLADGSAAELLGPGALLAPRGPGSLAPPGSGSLAPPGSGSLALPGYHVRFEALETSRIGAVGPLDAEPERAAALIAGFERVDAERAALQALTRLTGVDRRLLALFGLLAARRGRRTPDGIAVPIAIPHRLLADLVGARRPTVTTALRALRGRGDLRRLQDGTWLLRDGAADRSSA